MPTDTDAGEQDARQSQSDANANGARSTQTVPPEQTAQYWIDKYNGASGFGTKEKARADRLAGEKDTLIQDYEARIATLAGERDTFKTERDALTSTATTAATELAAFKRRDEVGRMIRKDFPALAELHDDGLLLIGDLDGEPLKEHLTRLNGKFDALRKDGVTQTLAGAVPPAPVGTTPQAASTDLLTLRKNLAGAMQKGVNSAEYKTAFDQYNAAIQQLQKQNGAKA